MGKFKSIIEVPHVEAKMGGSLYGFVYDWILKKYEREYRPSDDFVILFNEDSAIQPTWAELTALHVAGGDWHGIQTGIELPGTESGVDVPIGLRGGTYVDDTDPENPVDAQYTWLEWLRQSGLTVYKHTSSNTFIFQGAKQGAYIGYRNLATNLFNSDIFNHDELLLINPTNADVIEWSVFRSRVEGVDWEPYPIPEP